MDYRALQPRRPSSNWYREGMYSETIEPAKVLLDTQHQFVSDTRQRAPTDEYNYFSVRELSQLEQIVQELLGDAEDTKNKWVKNRSKASRHVQNFATKFSGFLESYSGIVEVVKGADQQYGGLAYGTLSMFLIIAVNKSRQEKVIEDTMDILKSSLPRMKASREIYPSREVEFRVAEVYTGVMHFVRESVKYYQRPGYLRLWHAVSRPPQIGSKSDVDRILCKINEVKEEMIIKLNERVRNMQNQLHTVEEELNSIKSDVLVVKKDVATVESGVKTVKTGVETVEFGVQKMQRDQVHAHMNDLRTLLVPTWRKHDTHNAQLTSYRVLLAQTFESEDAQAAFSDLEEKSEYLQWRANEHSCILRLSGDTTTNHTGLCWLSNTVPGIVDKFRLEGQPIIFHLAQRQHSMLDGVSVQEIVSSLIFQLLQLKPQILRDRKLFDEIHRKLKMDAWSTDLGFVCKTLVVVLEEFEVMNIILDRIDRGVCSGQAPRFIGRLLETLSVSKCNTRILLVTKPASGMDWNIDLSDDMRRKCMYLSIAKWDQEITTTRRRKRH